MQEEAINFEEAPEPEVLEGEVMKPLKRVKAVRAIVKKADLNSRAAKYFMARRKGKGKVESAISAGYPPSTASNPHKIEATKTYQAIEKLYYKDELLRKISLEQIAAAHADNILQDEDRGARNKAIEMAMGKLEPDKIAPEEDKVFVILREE